jgi:hypothetical protein
LLAEAEGTTWELLAEGDGWSHIEVLAVAEGGTTWEVLGEREVDELRERERLGVEDG